MAIQEKKTQCRSKKDFQDGDMTGRIEREEQIQREEQIAQEEQTVGEGKASGQSVKRQDAGQEEVDLARGAALFRLGEAMERKDPAAEDILWETLILFQNEPYYTAKGLDFTYSIKGNEMFVTRKDKSITRATVVMSFKKALELEGCVKGPKKLGTFGASYLYPVFQRIGIIKEC